MSKVAKNLPNYFNYSRYLKIKELAIRGVGGEKANAQALLDKMQPKCINRTTPGIMPIEEALHIQSLSWLGC